MNSPTPAPRSPNTVVTRFAPSPTGYLHIGGARTALFNWAFAKRHGGVFILRMEDTDTARSTPQATRQIIDDLKWLGLQWDEGPTPDHQADPYAYQIGDHGPYFQSQRGTLYQEYLNKLRDAGRVYDDKGAVRFKMPEHDITVQDQVLGDVVFKREQLEDFIIFKGEAAGSGPTFHFANVVDDATMGVTHVLRAQEHLMNTPKHLALFEALGIQPPKYAHMPLIFNPDSSKMSKRDKAKAARQAAQMWIKNHGNDLNQLVAHVRAHASQDLSADLITQFLEKKTDANEIAIPIAQALKVHLPEIDVHDFRKSGYLKEVLLNYVALLGWNPGGNVERFDLNYLQQEFDLERLGKSNARFDRAKLLAFNADALAKLSPDDFYSQVRKHQNNFGPQDFVSLMVDQTKARKFCDAYQARSKTLGDPMTMGRFFVQADDAIEFDPKAVAKVLHKDDATGLKMLQAIEATLGALSDFEPAAIHQALESLATKLGKGMGDIAQPIRVAVTGTTVSPAIQDTLAILGKDSTIKRIRRCLQTQTL